MTPLTLPGAGPGAGADLPNLLSQVKQSARSKANRRRSQALNDSALGSYPEARAPTSAGDPTGHGRERRTPGDYTDAAHGLPDNARS